MRPTIYLLLLLLCLISSCNNEEAPEPESKLAIEYKLISVPDALNRNGWGYEIYVDQKRFIIQDIIPGIGGMRVFKSAEDATRVAKLVIEKIRKNPTDLPTIHIKELVQLGTIDLTALSVEPYQKASGGWGFHIMLDQIPSMSYDWFPGFDQGLPNEEAANKVGAYVITKMQQQFYYPEIEASDLKQLGIT